MKISYVSCVKVVSENNKMGLLRQRILLLLLILGYYYNYTTIAPNAAT